MSGTWNVGRWATENVIGWDSHRAPRLPVLASELESSFGRPLPIATSALPPTRGKGRADP